MHTYDILRSPIGFWFSFVGWSAFRPIQPRAGARRIGVFVIYYENLVYGYEDKFVTFAMNYEAASLSLDFEVAWSQLAPTLRAQFVRSGFQLAST